MDINHLNEFESSLETLTSESDITAGEIIIGSLVSINDSGQALVDFSLNPSNSPIQAMSTAPITQQQVNRQVALLFNQGDLRKPIIMGLIHSPLQAMLDNFGEQPETEKVEELAGDVNIDDVKFEGNKMIFEAQEEMVFKCGESSITLTKSGKVLIRGKYLLNRSSGVNRIMGGSVQVN